MKSKSIGTSFALISVLIAAATAQAQLTWTPTSGGLFNTPGNWSPAGPPGAGQVAQYTTTTTQTITFETNVTVAAHRIENGNLTFQLNQTAKAMSGGSGSAASFSAAVPEPSALLLATWATLAVVVGGRKRLPRTVLAAIP